MKVTTGHNVSVHYKGTLKDGTEFDNSRVRGTPLTFEVGDQRMIKGFSKAVIGMTVGETKSVTLDVEDAYGLEGIYVGVPTIIGASGVERILEINLNKSESEEFQKSISAVEALIHACKNIEQSLA